MRRAEGRTIQASSWTLRLKPTIQEYRLPSWMGFSESCLFWLLSLALSLLTKTQFNKELIEHLGCCMLSGCIQQCLLPPECPFRPPIVPTTIGGISGMWTVPYFCHWCHRMFLLFITTIITHLKAWSLFYTFIGKCEFQRDYILCQQRRKGFPVKLFSTF